MAWNGSGTFTRTNGTNTGTEVWQDDEAEGTNILSTLHDAHDQDLANGINNCLAKDGQNSPTADIDFDGHGITNITSLSGLLTLNGGRLMQRFDSMAAFIAATIGVNEVEVTSFYGGWGATAAGPRGRSRWHHDGTTGGTPTTNSAAAIIAAMATGKVISADGKGWVLTAGQKFTLYMFGAYGDRTTDDDAPFAEACVATALLGETLTIETGEYRLVDNQTVTCAGDLNIIAEPGAVIVSDKTDYNGTTTDAAFQLVITANNVKITGPLKFETDSALPIAKYIKFKGCDAVTIDDRDMQFDDVVYAIYCENCAGDFFFRFKVRDLRNTTGTVTVTHSSDPGRSADVYSEIDFENQPTSYTYSASDYQQYLFCFFVTGYSDSVPLGTVITNNRYQYIFSQYTSGTQGSMSCEEVDCAETWICNSTILECAETGPANADSGSTGGACVVAGGIGTVIMNAVANGVTFFMEASDPKARGYEVKNFSVTDKCVITHIREIGNAAYSSFSLGNSFEVGATETFNFNGTITGFERGPLIRGCRVVRTAGIIDKPYKQYFHFVNCERMFVNTLGQRGGYVLRDTDASTNYGAILLTNNTAGPLFSRFLVVSDAAYKSMQKFGEGGDFVTYGGTASDACSILGVPSDSAPSVGTYVRGDKIWRESVSAAGVEGVICVTSGSFENLTGVTVTKNADNSNEYTVTAGIEQLYEGQFIDVAGIATTQRIVYVDRVNDIIVTDYAEATAVTNAAVSTADPTFKNFGAIAA